MARNAGALLASDVLAALDSVSIVSDAYADLLQSAFAEVEPPYALGWYGERFRDCATDPNWLASSLLANAQKEADGSRKLWDFSGRISDPVIAEAVRRHAVDEARHATYYLSLLRLVFCNDMSEADYRQLLTLSPQYRIGDHPPASRRALDAVVFDELAQMNIGEIRTRLHQKLLRPVLLEWCPTEARDAVEGILSLLMRDETRHIAYTAEFLGGAWAADSSRFVRSIYRRRVSDFNEITLQEVGLKDFSGS